MGSNPATGNACGGDCPVETVSFYDVIDFANALSTLKGLKPAIAKSGSGYTQDLDADGYRLPTEAEWEYAARCGDDTLYAGSDNHNLVGWVDETATQEVAQLAANSCGLYDMTGNVSEWVWDAYNSEYYAVSDSVDPTGPDLDSPRTIRGGSIYDYPSQARVSTRDLYIVANWGMYYIGVRLVRTGH
ncbi:MAG TPA: hypothetical protein EYN66_00865 [Myxococcales bacterium]|nr:hypothetical protein [Myxococcales bacterium]